MSENPSAPENQHLLQQRQQAAEAAAEADGTGATPKANNSNSAAAPGSLAEPPVYKFQNRPTQATVDDSDPEAIAAAKARIEAARGKTVNLPIPGMLGDAHYVEAFKRAFLPILQEFEPEMVFVSAGFDAGLGDGLGGMEVGWTLPPRSSVFS